MGIEDKSLNKKEKEGKLYSEKVLAARKTLLNELSTFFNIEMAKLKAYVVQPERDKRIFEEIKKVPHYPLIAGEIDNLSTEFYLVLNDLSDDISENQMDAMMRTLDAVQEFKESIFEEFYPMQSGEFHDFEIAAQRLRVTVMALAALNPEKAVRRMEDLFLEDLADIFYGRFEKMPSNLKILLTEESKKRVMGKKPVDFDVDEALEYISKKTDEERKEKERDLFLKGVHQKIAERIGAEEMRKLDRVMGEIVLRMEREEPLLIEYVEGLLEKYGDPRVIIREIIGDKAAIPKAEIKKSQ